MAPEVINQQSYNSNADLWSFGIVMHQMLFGLNTHPIEKISTNSKEQLRKDINKNNIRIKNDDISEECIDLLQNILHKDPKKRITWDDFIVHSWFENTLPRKSIAMDIPKKITNTKKKLGSSNLSRMSFENYEDHCMPTKIGSFSPIKNTVKYTNMTSTSLPTETFYEDFNPF
jgi:serine/threonine protein kinase